jgi:hypothetical protein
VWVGRQVEVGDDENWVRMGGKDQAKDRGTMRSERAVRRRCKGSKGTDGGRKARRGV